MVNPRICIIISIATMAMAIITVRKASRTIINTVIRDYYKGHDAYRVTTVIKAIAAIMVKTATIVTITIMAIMAMPASRSY